MTTQWSSLSNEQWIGIPDQEWLPNLIVIQNYIRFITNPNNYYFSTKEKAYLLLTISKAYNFISKKSNYFRDTK